MDAVITDPPYSSGGFSRDDKAKSVADKYQQSGTKRTYREAAYVAIARERIDAAQGMPMQDGLFNIEKEQVAT